MEFSEASQRVASRHVIGSGEPELLDRGFALVGAVHQLVSVTRATTKLDLVLAAASHALRGGDKTAEEIGSIVHRVWPGAQVDTSTVEQALTLGRELGVVLELPGLAGTAVWQLTPRGVADVESQERWVARVRGVATEELKERARTGLGIVPSDEQAELWLERIVEALIGGITASQDAYLGRVDHLLQRRLAPRGFDQQKVMDLIRDDRTEPATLEFLSASALAALDPLDTFASDLVSHITTGCVLHSYVAGRDSSAVLGALGSPANQRALLDTPILVDLIGPDRLSQKVEFSISVAVDAGWDVVVCQHSLDELSILVDREIPKIKRDFTAAHEAGVRQEWYAALAENQLPTYCVEVLRDGKYQHLDEMRAAAVELGARLAELGVTVREHCNHLDFDRVEQCRIALLADLAGTAGRSAEVVQRDADSMAIVWRRRRREPQDSKWPGGWIITPDRHMKNAYRTVARHDLIPLTLTMSQWSTLASVTVPPTDVVALARAGATQLVEEAMWLLPSRFPSDVALELARQISPDRGGSDTDLRYAQLTLDAALAESESQSATSLAADVLEARSRRRQTLQSQELERAQRGRADALATASASDRRAHIKEEEAAAAHRAKAASDVRVDELQAALDWQRTRTMRIAIGLVIGAILVIAPYVAFTEGFPLYAVLILVGAAVTWAIAAWKWCQTSAARVLPLVIAAAVELVGLVSALVGLALQV